MCILPPTAQMQLVQGLWKIVIVCAVVIAGLVLVALERDGTLAPNVSSWLLWLPLEAVALLALGITTRYRLRSPEADLQLLRLHPLSEKALSPKDEALHDTTALPPHPASQPTAPRPPTVEADRLLASTIR